MDVLISGLNSYIGRRAASHLHTDGFQVYGLVRDKKLFESMVSEPITAQLYHVDLLKKGASYSSFRLPHIDMGIFFTQSPFLGDLLSLQVELNRLKSFIELLKRNFCFRILFMARLIDKNYIHHIQQLFEEYGMRYTIVLKNIALGKGSLADRYFRKLLTDKYVIYDEALADISFRPLFALDVLRWIRTIDWLTQFQQQVIELGGMREMTVRELFRLYKKLNHVDSVGLPIPHFIYNMLFSKKIALHEGDLLEIKRLLKYEYPLDNTTWAKKVPFSFTPIEEVILRDQ